VRQFFNYFNVLMSSILNGKFNPVIYLPPGRRLGDGALQGQSRRKNKLRLPSPADLSRASLAFIIFCMGKYIAVDIGGTRLRVAVYEKDQIEPLKQERIATQGPGSPMERLVNLIKHLWPQENDVLAIGAAAPGPINPKTGVLYRAPNIPGWDNLPLRKSLEDAFNIPVAVGNDANMAALGEARFGAGVGHSDLIYITISTGIGGGVILDNRLVLGARGLAAEIGHVTVVPNGPLCGCGKRGHLESVASGTAIARWMREQIASGRSSSLNELKSISAKDVAEAADRGDALAIQAMTQAGTFMGVALADYMHIFNPTMVILGGGVSRSGPNYMEPMKEALYAHVISPKYLEDLEITLAALGDDAGLLGTLELARIRYQELHPKDDI
jgi:glucokinase